MNALQEWNIEGKDIVETPFRLGVCVCAAGRETQAMQILPHLLMQALPWASKVRVHVACRTKDVALVNWLAITFEALIHMKLFFIWTADREDWHDAQWKGALHLAQHKPYNRTNWARPPTNRNTQTCPQAKGDKCAGYSRRFSHIKARKSHEHKNHHGSPEARLQDRR